MKLILGKIRKLPVGYSEVVYLKQTYGVTRTDFNKGNSHKVYAEEIGGKDVISLNYFCTVHNHYLKPCEMPEERVIDFLNEYRFLRTHLK